MTQPAVRLVRADNPGPMTLEGTNTWLVGRRRVLVVDPGPADDAHLRAVLDAVGPALAGVLLTHRHPDHSEALGAPLLRAALARAGAPVLAADPSLGDPVTPEAVAAVCDEPAEPLALAGHTDDSVGLVVAGERVVLTGDTVLGRGTSVVAHPDGDLGAHLASLRRLRALLDGGGVGGGGEGDHDGTRDDGGARPWRGLPGHGPEVPDLARRVEELLRHRAERVRQVREALALLDPGRDRVGARAPADDDGLVAAVVAHVYPDLTDPVLLGAAGRTVRATLVHLARSDATG
ncbi:MBL fold metallo-hydrolase [Aquipuribacter sp. SD81]|uniref:MBL fold metallo-hydrolase n=1 Tax=Aquipuribacter sp. SD81 TaxID=3127703 RepID=UPI0030174299